MEKEATLYRALVVDDSSEIRALLSRALAQEKILCHEAEDGLAAENRIRHNTYDVLVTDLRMPKKHGHKLIVDLLQEGFPGLIIVMTGVAEPKLVADLIGRGVTDVVEKPITFPILAAKIRALLDRKTGQGK